LNTQVKRRGLPLQKSALKNIKPHLITALSQEQVLTATDTITASLLGSGVSLSADGKTALIGAPGNNAKGLSGAGAAYIFSYNGSSWVLQQELNATDAATNAKFGSAVSLSADGKTALIGAIGNTVNSNSSAGAAYIFSYSGSSWSQQQELSAVDATAYDIFGFAVSLSGDGKTALIGAVNHAVSAGAAYVFSYSGSSWSQQQEFSAPAAFHGDLFGTAVSLSNDGSTALIGSTGKRANNNPGAGAAYVYTYSVGSWNTTPQTLTASDGSVGARFGAALNLSSDGKTALIGATIASVNGNSAAGIAYIFNYSGSSWSQQQELTASDAAANANFGSAVSLSSDGKTALVGASGGAGAAYTFGYSGSSWSQQQKLTASDGATGDSFGASASLSGDSKTVVVGALNKTVQDNSQAGTAYVFAPITPITLSSSPNPSSLGENVTFTTTITTSGNVLPTGSIVLTDTSTNTILATLSLNGSTNFVNYATNSLSIGTHTIIAAYSGDTNYGAGTSPGLVQQVSPPTIAVAGGNGQSTPISTTFPVALSAIVRDSLSGAPAAGIVVTFVAPAGGPSGLFATTNATTVTATTDINGIATAPALTANGVVGSYVVQAITANAAAPAIFNLVNNPANAAQGYSYYLPFLANAYHASSGSSGSFTTYLVFQNTAAVSTTISLSYFDAAGNTVAVPASTCVNVPAWGECVAPNPFASGQRGEAILTSLQPLNVIVSEATPYGGSAYAAVPGAASTLLAPAAIRGGLVDFTTQLNVFNGGDSAASGTIQFYDQTGTHISAADKTFSLAAHTTITYDQLNDTTLGNSFYGWVRISGAAGNQLVAQVLEQRPSVQFVAVVNAQFNPQTNLYAPAIFNGAFGPFVTGTNLVNPNSTPVTVTVSYYRNDGTLLSAAPFSIAAYGVTGIFQGATNVGASGVLGLPSGGLPSGWYGSAQVNVAGSNGIIMFVNEQGGTTGTGSDQSGTYGAAVSGASSVGLPVMANGAFGGYVTGATVANTTDLSVAATIQYYDLSGALVGTPKAFTVGPHASYSLYQGDAGQGLAAGFYGTAVVNVTSGPTSSLLVTTNAQSNAFFYSYTDPAQ
jgi:hypothetical protein